MIEKEPIQLNLSEGSGFAQTGQSNFPRFRKLNRRNCRATAASCGRSTCLMGKPVVREWQLVRIVDEKFDRPIFFICIRDRDGVTRRVKADH